MGNREALLEAAIVCLREHGFGGTRARDLAGTAGVSLGAIRYHFGSTEALLNAAIAESSQRWLRSFQASVATAPDAAAGIAGPVGRLYDVFSANQALFVGFIEALAHAQRSEPARAQLAGYYDEFRREIARTLGDSGQPDVNTDSVALVLIVLVDGLGVQWMLDPQRCPDPALLQRAAIGLFSLATAPAEHS